MKKYEFWFVVGSQLLYGEEVLDTVARRAEEMAKFLSSKLPFPVVYKVTAKSSDEISSVIREANYRDECAGIITWCHTFSPSKMWISGLNSLQKPWCHFATQYNREIPNEEIDMDFMNLNQAAHGDREHGFIGARLRSARKIIAGYWKDEDVQKRLASWMKSAVGAAFSKEVRVMRFGDNMRDVAVTEGDKVEAQKKFGWQVNTWATGDLVKEMSKVTEAEIDALMEEYKSSYDIATDNTDAIRYQAKEEIAMEKMLKREKCTAFSNTFQDLYGMEQLPGLASQHLMSKGYGYGGEGDWKVSALTAIMKVMGENGNGASAFMEDYTYHLVPGSEYSLGAHMLEVCPSLAADRPRIETHHLGIGMNEKDPARLVFEGKAGEGIVACIIDMGGRFRLIIQDIEAVKPIMDMPNLPVARVMWKALPDLRTGLECWICAGGAHHTVLSYDVTAEQMIDWARIMDIECVHITKDTTVESLERELLVNDLVWKLK
ncbi:L-arabinose isomerase [Ruminococcus sp. HUN007]|uniref:L-arabinose isomerase n=1 Tax=Ruminococcus sp. HUN007 TaxID=1514668 RepID=UPI0005D26A3B|nr:L-arabinose isomerase [Ruminococcus sp. HUN007]